jgi:1L-myo-inositol 1-phosphate cytidylyltransferase / CDP-L-myo-inositol myo-inositolphosphotransferase
MALVAVLFAEPDPDAADLRIGGIPIDLRQCREMEIAKASPILVVGGGAIAGRGSEQALSVATPGDLVRRIGDDDDVLVLAPGLVVDDRIIALVRAHSAPCIAFWPQTVPPRGVERIDPQRLAAGVALYRGADVRAIAAELGEWDLHSTLLRSAAADPEVTMIDLAAIDTYAPARRRDVPFIWEVPTDLASAAHATDVIVEAAQKGCLDWPARLVHPPIEDALVRLLAPTSVTPNMVTLFVAAIGIVAGIAFYAGWLWTGLVLALVTGPLDGVDGKLARATLTFSRFGDLEHVLDKLCEYGWYLCLAAYFARVDGHAGPWAFCGLLVLFALAESLQGEYFRRFTGRQLDDWGVFERRFRLVSGRRNTFFWTLLPFAAVGAWYPGFVVMALYSVVTFFVMQTRFFIRLQQFGSANSQLIAANFARTAYDFLPARLRSSR